MEGERLREIDPGNGWGWFAYTPTSEAIELPAEPVAEVSLLRDEHGGPFRDETGPRGADFDGLHGEVGLSRELFDDAMAWYLDHVERPQPTPDDWDHGHRRREHELWQRLRAEVPKHVWVCPADYAPRPVRVRMFVDGGTGLWADSVGWPPRGGFEEETLPISPELRQAIRDWVDDYDRIEGLDHDWTEDMVQHDRDGHELSGPLQTELGDGYRVEYGFHTRQARRDQEPDR